MGRPMQPANSQPELSDPQVASGPVQAGLQRSASEGSGSHQHRHTNVSKWKLARAFVRWLSAEGIDALTVDERRAWESMVKAVNKALA